MLDVDDKDRIHRTKEKRTPGPKLQVRVSPLTKRALDPIFSVGRQGAAMVEAEARKIGTREALLLLKQEQLVPKEYALISVAPTKELLDHAEETLLPPHFLVRAAAIKMAEALREEVLKGEDVTPIEVEIPQDSAQLPD